MQIIYNLTQHQATPEQVAQGVNDLEQEEQAKLKQFLTFNTIPSKEEINERAKAIVALVPWDADAAMIGGAPYLMSALERELTASNVKPLYAFSVRESVEKQNPDGTVTKVNVFRHAGFVEA